MGLEKIISNFNISLALFSGIGMGIFTTYLNSDDLSQFFQDKEALIAGGKQFLVTGLSSGYTARLTQKLSKTSPYKKSILYPTGISTISASTAHLSPILDTPNPTESIGFVMIASIAMTTAITMYERKRS